MFNSHRVRVQWIQMSVVRLTREFVGQTGENNGWTLYKEGSSCSLWILTTVEKKESMKELSHNSMWVPRYFTSTLITYCQGRNSYMLVVPSRCIGNGLNPDILSAALERCCNLPWLFFFFFRRKINFWMCN